MRSAGKIFLCSTFVTFLVGAIKYPVFCSISGRSVIHVGVSFFRFVRQHFGNTMVSNSVMKSCEPIKLSNTVCVSHDMLIPAGDHLKNPGCCLKIDTTACFPVSNHFWLKAITYRFPDVMQKDVRTRTEYFLLSRHFMQNAIKRNSQSYVPAQNKSIIP